MNDIKNTFLRGIMNKDLDERLVPEGQYRDALNVTIETSDGSNVGAVQNSLGNTLAGLSIADVSGRNPQGAKTIGCTEFEAGNLIYWFVAADYFDGIYEYNADTDTTVRVLQSNKTGPSDTSKLNFNQQYPINGVNFIIGPDGNNFLYWTDDYNPPRRINVTRVKSNSTGQSGYLIDDARIDEDINVSLKPPMYAPKIELIESEEFEESNNISEKFLYFAYRFLYVDNQYSSLSPFSAVAFKPKEFEFDYATGNNNSMTNFYNAVNVSFDTGNQFVKAVQLVVRDTKNINVSIVETYNKQLLGWDTLNNESKLVTFGNNKVLSALPIDQVTRLFDNVPLLAKAQDVIGNRLAYGNYVQFRDIRDCSNEEIKIDYKLDLKEYDVDLNSPKSTWKTDRDIELALLYSDEYGRLTTALTCDDGSIHIPASNADTSNSIRVRINHKAPCWATHYRLAIKESKGEYYNIFPILYYVDGVYRYILINDTDRDKVKAGDYIKIKTPPFNANNSARKYKVLEVRSYSSGFLVNVTGNEVPGVYIKIKVESAGVMSVDSLTQFSGTHLAPMDWAPVVNRCNLIEKPIHYGVGNPLALQVATPALNYNLNIDLRFYFEVLPNNQFRYSLDRNQSENTWVGPLNITNGVMPIQVTNQNGSITTPFSITINSSIATIGDKWVVNCRTADSPMTNYYGGVGLSDAYEYGGGVVVTYNWVANEDRIIQPGAVIRITCLRDDLGQPYTTVQQWYSDARYENIEEWFNESSAWSTFVANNSTGQNVGAQAVTFRRGTSQGYSNLYPYVSISQGDTVPGSGGLWEPFQDILDRPIHMIIQGFGYEDSGLNQPGNFVEYKLEIDQLEDQLVLETVSKDSDVDIFHELSRTYPIVNSEHKVTWKYSDYEFNNGSVQLRQFERDVPHYFNVGERIEVSTTTPGLSGTWTVISTPDLYTIVTDAPWPGSGPTIPGFVRLENSDDVDQDGFSPAFIEVNKPGMTNTDFNAWSWGNGIESNRIFDDFNDTTLKYSVRATTVIENYKQIRNDASICYSGIYNENTQYNRLNEFNLSLANFKYLDREFGSIQRLYGRDTDVLVFQEDKVSVVLKDKNALTDSVGGGQIVSIPQVLGTQLTLSGEYGISRNPESFARWGDSVFFTDARRGAVLSVSGRDILIISDAGMMDYFRDLMRDNPFTQKLGGYDPFSHQYVLHNSLMRSLPCALKLSRDRLSIGNQALGYILFGIDTEVSWTITVEDMGFGTNWVSDYPTSGTGVYSINANVSQNLLGSNRSVRFVVSFCNGQTQEFILTQAKGRKGSVVTLVFMNKLERK
jgi:hypothetical protein